MNSWFKSILTLSILASVVSFGLLAWLAMQTTQPIPRQPEKVSAWGQKLPGDSILPMDRKKTPDFTAIAAAARSILELAERLHEMNAAHGVKSGELLLTFKTAEAQRAFRERAAALGFTILHDDPRLLTSRVAYDDPVAMARELRQNAASLDGVGLNYLAWVPGLPETGQTDSNNAGGVASFGNSGLDAIGAAGDRTRWGQGTKVALLDTGVTAHPVLNGNLITHVDLVKDGKDPNGHGTAMASLIAGKDTFNGGVAPASEILDYRVADTQGESNTALVAEAIMKAVDAGAMVINISLGSTGDSLMLERAIKHAQSRGVVIVAAAGNEQRTTLSYPAAYPGVISVAAMDAQGNQAFFSNSGETLTLSAPGVGIVSAYSGNQMVVSSGTSQATALTSGVVSTLLGRGYLSADILQTLVSHAQPSSAPRRQVGAGLVQLPKP